MNVLKEYFLGCRQRMCDGIDEFLILNEGLISSYDTNLLIKKLQKYFVDRIEIGEHTKPMFDYKSYSFYIHIKNYDKQDEENLNKILNVFGYYIVNGNSASEKYIYRGKTINTITIEPKYPIIINDVLKKNKVEFLYHITPLDNLEKINKYGLAPRGTETTFYHPDDRIYLIYSKSVEYIKEFKKTLSENKSIKFKLEDDALKMVVLKVKFDDNFDYFLDDSVITNVKNTYGCFVLKNISPDKIEITNL